MKETLKEFMKDYDGFNWENGKLIIVTKDGNPTIFSGSYKAYKAILKKYLNDFVWDWAHDTDTMVITLYR